MIYILTSPVWNTSMTDMKMYICTLKIWAKSKLLNLF